MEILLISLCFLKMLMFCQITSGINIFTNIDNEKTKSDSDADALIRRYTDSDQMIKRHKKDTIFIIRMLFSGSNTIQSSASLILPPSKPLMGNKLSIPSDREETIKSEVALFVKR